MVCTRRFHAKDADMKQTLKQQVGLVCFDERQNKLGGTLVKRTCLVFVVATALLCAVPVLAGGGARLFVSKCGSCHKRGGAAAPVNPADKAAVVWGKYFRRNRHEVDLSDKISDGEMDAILDYLKAHAADSDKPEAAAIPK